MNRALPRANSSKLQVGSLVSLSLGTQRVQGEIVEDRGPLGAEGKNLYRVRIPITPDESLSFELSEDELSLEETAKVA